MKKTIACLLTLALLLGLVGGLNVFAAEKAAAASERAASLSSKGYLWPITGKIFSRGFTVGVKGVKDHYGVDILAAKGTAVVSTAAGTVTCSSMASASADAECSNCGFEEAGYHVVVRHADGISAIYGHLSKTSVSKGSTVTAGQKIGEVGSTGFSTGPHLHFALYKGGINAQHALDPMVYTSPFSNIYATDITNTSATLYGVLGNAGMSMVSGGFYIGTSPDNMTKITETMNTNGYISGVAIKDIFYGTGKWYKTLQPGTTYYYKMWVNYYGKEHVSVVKSFTTTGGHTHSWDGGIITKAPTCTEPGERTYHCNGCTNTKTENIAAVGHDYQADYIWSLDHETCEAVITCSRQCGECITKVAEVSHDTSDPYQTIHKADVPFGEGGFSTAFTCDIHVTGFSLSLEITSFGEDDEEVTLTLLKADQEIASALVWVDGYQFEGIAPGNYTLVVSKKNHVTRSYPVTIDHGSKELEVKLHLMGDIDGNGKINVGDVAKLNGHIKGTAPLTDEYQLLCANVNGGSLNMGDTAALYAHVKNTKPLF